MEKRFESVAVAIIISILRFFKYEFSAAKVGLQLFLLPATPALSFLALSVALPIV